MAIASLIVRADAGFEEQTVAAIEAVEGLSVHTITENKEIIVLAEAPTLEAIGNLGSAVQEFHNVWSVTFAYANNEDLEPEMS